MKSSGDNSKNKSGKSVTGRATQSEETGVQTKDELRAYHKMAADIFVGLDEASSDSEDPCERLILASLRRDGRFDRRRYWNQLRAVSLQQQMKILADAESPHWRVGAGGVDRVTWFIFRSHYVHHKTAGDARYKAVHGLRQLNRREAIAFVEFANEVAMRGDSFGKELLAGLVIARIKQCDHAIFSQIGEALKRPGKEVTDVQDGSEKHVEKEVFRSFCRLYIRDGVLPTKAQVRKECSLGEVGKDVHSATKAVNPAFKALGLSGLPEDRGGAISAKRLTAALEAINAVGRKSATGRIGAF